jgi:hypothetical protein
MGTSCGPLKISDPGSMLAENGESTLTPKQVKYAEAVTHPVRIAQLDQRHPRSGKIESGKWMWRWAASGSTVARFLSRTFRHADGKGLEVFDRAGRQPAGRSITTDAKRLQQVPRTCRRTAKFTEHGSVLLKIDRATSGWSPDHPCSIAEVGDRVLRHRPGDGIPQDKQRIIFEAFQQADGTTSRKFGSTVPLISRELTRLLGGEIRRAALRGRQHVYAVLPQTYVMTTAPRTSGHFPAASHPVGTGGGRQ